MNIEKIIPATERIIHEKKPLTSREITASFSLKKRIILALVVVTIVVIGVLLWRPWKPRESPPPSAEKPSIAVLPFKDLSPRMDQQHLCSGIPSDLVQRLTQVEGLWIPAWASSSAFNAEDMDIKELGKKLNVDTLLTGTLQKADDKLRITVELINITDNDVIWTERYERDEGDIFELQDDVTLAIIDKLKVKLLGEEKAGFVRRHTDNVEAYNLYLQGRFLWNKRTPNDLKKSIEFYEKSIEKDPDFDLAYAGIADSYINLGDFMVLPPMAAFPNAKRALYKALELNNSLGEAHCSLAWVFNVFEWDFKSAENEFKRAIELNPNYATAHQWYGQYLAAMGRFEEAYKEIDKTLELDPLSLIINNVKGQILYFEGRYEDSIEQLKLTLEIDDRFLVSLIFLGWNYIAKGLYQEALDITQKALSFYEGYFPLLANSIAIYALSGQREKAQEMFDDLIAETSKIYIPSYVKADVFSIFGEKDKAFEWLERAYDEKGIPPDILKYGLWGENFRSDPRYKALLKKMNLE